MIFRSFLIGCVVFGSLYEEAKADPVRALLMKSSQSYEEKLTQGRIEYTVEAELFAGELISDEHPRVSFENGGDCILNYSGSHFYWVSTARMVLGTQEVPVEMKTAYDGIKMTRISPVPGIDSNGKLLVDHQGHISSRSTRPMIDVRGMSVNVFWIDEPLSRVLGSSESSLLRKEKLDGKPCYVLSKSNDRENAIVWVDSAIARPRQVEITRDESLIARLKISEFSLVDNGSLWFPKSGQREIYDPEGRLIERRKVVVTSVDVRDTFTPKSFEISFPPGMSVLDERTSEILLILEDGKSIREPIQNRE